MGGKGRGEEGKGWGEEGKGSGEEGEGKGGERREGGGKEIHVCVFFFVFFYNSALKKTVIIVGIFKINETGHLLTIYCPPPFLNGCLIFVLAPALYPTPQIPSTLKEVNPLPRRRVRPGWSKHP